MDLFNELLEEIELPVDGIKKIDNKFTEMRFLITENLLSNLRNVDTNNNTIFAYVITTYAILFHIYSLKNNIIISIENCSMKISNSYIPLQIYVNPYLCLGEIVFSVRNKLQTIQTRPELYIDALEEYKRNSDDINLQKFMMTMQIIDDKRECKQFLSNNSDLLINISISDKVTIQKWYRNELFKLDSVEQMANYAKQIFNAVLNTPKVIVEQINLNIATSVKQKNIQTPFNDIISYILENCKNYYKRNCLVDEKQIINYKQLEEQVTFMHNELKKHGIKEGNIIAVIGERSITSIIAMLAILKAKAIYLPICNKMPLNRISYMLEDCKPFMLITDSKMKSIYLNKYLTIDFNGQVLNKNIPDIFEQPPQIKNGAYIIYTSGTSGNPKGVVLPNQGIINLRNFFLEELHISQNDIIGQFANISFDASLWEIFMSLFAGAELNILPEDILYDFERFTEYVNEKSITVLTLPPQFALQLNPSSFKKLRMIITAGSPATMSLMENWSDYVDYVNAYGPTECSICATALIIRKGKFNEKRLTIGYPISDYTIRITGSDNKERPPYMVGEITIQGAGVSFGYINNSTLTEKKYRNVTEQTRLFRTGDLGRFVEDGKIEFLGRKDSQVKIRGYRIELNEIKHLILSLQLAKDAIINIVEDGQGDSHICAYLIANNDLDINKIHKTLSEYLPTYMLPERYVFIESITMTSNGKIDYSVLPNPYIEKQNKPADKNVSMEVLSSLWNEILGIEYISANDNFFLLGGHSLKAIILRNKISKKFGVYLDIKEIYKAPVLKDQINLIIQKQSQKNQSKGTE